MEQKVGKVTLPIAVQAKLDPSLSPTQRAMILAKRIVQTPAPDASTCTASSPCGLPASPQFEHTL